MNDDTIFALATPKGRAGVAVIRISGENSFNALQALCGVESLEPRKATIKTIKNPTTGDKLDKGLIIYFKAPASFTGEDVAELQIHGGRAVTMAVLEALTEISGLRQAEAGEFTRRAFENNKLDLTEVEGLADLINAETEEQRKQALRQMEGSLGKLYESWRKKLVKSLAYLEAEIDFPEDELPQEILQNIQTQIYSLINEISEHLNDKHRGERLRDGFHVAVIGLPNAGKSTLCNKLVKRDIAIVSKHEGTTRDIVEAYLDLGGYPVIIADTAGLRECSEEIESEGVKRAFARAENADLVIVLIDGTKNIENQVKKAVGKNRMYVVNKIDLHQQDSDFTIEGKKPIYISAKADKGIGALLENLTTAITEKMSCSTPALTRTRHRTMLTECVDYLKNYKNENDIELAAENVRLASKSLGRITGKIEVEELLDVVFADFCIGK